MYSITRHINQTRYVYLKLAVDNDALNILEGSRLDQLQQIFHSILVRTNLVNSVGKLRKKREEKDVLTLTCFHLMTLIVVNYPVGWLFE